MKKFLIVLVAIVTMLAIQIDATARTRNIDDRHLVVTRKPKYEKRLKKCKKKPKKIDYGQMRCTAYCPCEKCSKGYGRETSTEATAVAGRTIAVDPDVIDIGSKVEINGDVYIAEDVGADVVGETIDIFFDTHEEVEEFGVKHKHAWVIKE